MITLDIVLGASLFYFFAIILGFAFLFGCNVDSMGIKDRLFLLFWPIYGVCLVFYVCFKLIVLFIGLLWFLITGRKMEIMK